MLGQRVGKELPAGRGAGEYGKDGGDQPGPFSATPFCSQIS